MKRTSIVGLIGSAAGLGAGLVAQRSMVNRRRRNDPEAGEPFGKIRGERSKYLTTGDGAKLFVEEIGPADARAGVLFLHGSALRTDLWHYQMKHGFGGRRLLFADLRGHGLSQPRGEADFTIATLAGDVVGILENAGLDEVVLVGHSVSGQVILKLCIDRPELLGSLIKGIVLTNTSPRAHAQTTAGAAAVARLERFTRRPLEVVGSRAHQIDVIRKIIKPSDGIFWTVSFAAFGQWASARQIDFAYDMLAETSTDVILDLIKCYRDFDVELAEVTIPALVIGGEKDRITVPEASEEIASMLPKAELKMFPGCGHMTMLERHREFNELITEHLDDVLGPVTGGRKAKRR